MRFSICIPTYEYEGLAPDLLNTLLLSIHTQTFDDYEIVVVDHSKTDIVKNSLDLWDDLPIRYYRNERGRGNSSINMNEGIKLCKGEYIKIMHMDDWFCEPRALQFIDEAIQKETDKKWGGVGFNHFYEDSGRVARYIPPHIDWNLKTLLGCPSVSFFLNDNNFYDEELIIINDSDMHMRLGKKYGDPILVNEYCVTVRMSPNQVSNKVTDEQHAREIQTYRSKHF